LTPADLRKEAPMIYLLLLATTIGLLVYFRVPLLVGSVTVVLSAVLWIVFAQNLSGAEQGICWIIVVAALACGIPAVRRKFLSKILLERLHRKLPPISEAERHALEAGTVWWEREIFSGHPDWEKLHNLPYPSLTAEEQQFLDTEVETVCSMLDDNRIVSDLHDLPLEAWNFIKENKFWGMIIPKEYGGLGFSAIAQSQVIAKIASRSIAAAVTVMVPNSLGPAELLLRYGTEQQKQRFLPRLAVGEEVPCLALTGPEAGSDAASLPDTGTVCRDTVDGKEVLGLRLNWEKRYITLGPVATLLGLAFRVRDPEHLLGEDPEPGITLALIPTSLAGITIGRRHDPLGIPFQNGPNLGRDVFIPLEYVVGGQSGIGRGWKMIMECLAAGRSVSMPALCAGVGKYVGCSVGAYARIRRQFRLAIGRFEGIEEVLARITGSLYGLDAMRWMTCGALDLGERPSVISAVIKYFATEQMRKVVNDGMDVVGGSGICMGPRNLLGRVYRAAPIGITVEGANILTRSMIIFGQGAIRCHPYILKEMEAMCNADAARGLSDFDRLMRLHGILVFRNAVRALALGITGARFAGSPHSPARRYYQQATRMATAFALATDLILMTLGGALKRRERISARLADVLIHLYLISALLKRFRESSSPREELPLLTWCCDASFHAIQESYMELCDNLPSRPAGWLLRWLAFPVGRCFRKPGDRLGHHLAGILMEPSDVRDRLISGIFISDDPEDPLRRLEECLKNVVAAEPAEQKLREAVRSGRISDLSEEDLPQAGVRACVITPQESEQIVRTLAARREAIKVDDFAPTCRWTEEGA
jgi:acyl-CoA dehydrogenase